MIIIYRTILQDLFEKKNKKNLNHVPKFNILKFSLPFILIEQPFQKISRMEDFLKFEILSS